MRLQHGWIALVLLSTASAAELKQNTVAAWDQYVQTVDAGMQDRLTSPRQFLWIDEAPDRCRRLQSGEILVAPVPAHNPQRVPSGLIHHWIGAAFVPNAKAADILKVVRDYGHYRDYFHPAVVASELIRQDGGDDRFSIVMMNNAFLKSAIAVESESSYVAVDAQRWYSVSHSNRVQSIEEYGKPGEHRLPVDQGNGYIWRVHNITRLAERDGGVYIEVEALVLSRDIPGGLRWVADPIVRRVAKSSIVTTLQETEEAVNGTGGTSVVSSRLPAPAVSQKVNGSRAFVKQ